MHKWNAKQTFHEEDADIDEIISSIRYFTPSHKAFLPNIMKILKDIKRSKQVAYYLKYLSKEQINAIKDIPEYLELIRK